MVNNTGGKLFIEKEGHLWINPGGELIIDKGGELLNNGKIHNDGSIIFGCGSIITHLGDIIGTDPHYTCPQK